MMETNLEVFFGLKDWRCRKDDAFGSQEPLEGRLEWLSHLLPLLHPQVDFNLTSNELSSNGSKTRPSVFPGFTSYTIGPWKKTNINSLEHKFAKKGPEEGRDLLAKCMPVVHPDLNNCGQGTRP